MSKNALRLLPVFSLLTTAALLLGATTARRARQGDRAVIVDMPELTEGASPPAPEPPAGPSLDGAPGPAGPLGAAAPPRTRLVPLSAEVEPARPAVPPAAPAAPAARARRVAPSPAAAPATRRVWMLVTAYCPCAKCCGRYADGKTACGRSVYSNHSMFVAADTGVLPFGTRVSVPGYYGGAPVSVLDKGSRIKGNRLDVFFLSHEQARRWAARWLLVTVYED